MMSSAKPSAKPTPPSTPTNSNKRFVQRDILTTPRTAARAKVKGLYGTAEYTEPANFDEDTKFDMTSPLVAQTLQVGNSFFTYGKNMAEYKDATELYRKKDRAAMLELLEKEGYLLIRGAINKDRAQLCRDTMIQHLAKKDAIDTTKGPLTDAFIKNTELDGWTVDAETGGFVNNRESDSAVVGWKKIGWCDAVRNVYAGEDLHAVYRFLWGQERTETQDGYNALTHNTWLRAKAKGEITSEHADYYYFKKNTTTFQEHRHPYVKRDAAEWNKSNPLPAAAVKKGDVIECDICLRHFVASQQYPKATNWDKEEKGDWHCADCSSQYTPFYTCWISLGEYTDFNSTLCMMPKTHHLQQFDKPLRTDLLPEDYNQLVKDKWGWLRTNFHLGDIVIFNWKTVHGASKNVMSQFRFSIDTRISSEWIRPVGLYGKDIRLKYEYPADEVQKVADKNSGAITTKDICPTIENTLCPTVIDPNFDKAGNAVERKRKIGNISSKPKVMDDVIEEEEEEEKQKEEKKQPKKRTATTRTKKITQPIAPTGTRRSARINSQQTASQQAQEEEENENDNEHDGQQFVQLSLYGLDDVERFEIPHSQMSQTETDMSDVEGGSSQQTTPRNAGNNKVRGSKQHRILREREALLLEKELPIETANREQINLDAITEETRGDILAEEGEEENDNNNVALKLSNNNKNKNNVDDEAKRKKTRRREDTLDSDVDDEEQDVVTKKQRV